MVPFVEIGKTGKKICTGDDGVRNQEFKYGHAEFEMPVRYQRSTKPKECLPDISILVSHRHVNDKILAQLRQKGRLK